MRELKFRAWHEEDKVMVYDLNSPRLLHGVLQADDYKLMQYTGIKDKNGVEIYEGDYIITKYEKTPFLIKWQDYLDNCGDCFSDSGPGFNFQLRQPTDEIEVVGNIYQKPKGE